MDTTETQNRQGSRDKATDDNVIRLPRDWLGPRDQLVPFGPAAYRDAPEPDSEPPRSATDFWGGEDLQDIVPATSGADAISQPTRRWALPRVPRVPRLPRVSPPRVGLRLRAGLVLGVAVFGVLAAVGFVIGSVSRKPSASGVQERGAALPSAQAASAGSAFDARAAEQRETFAQRAATSRARHAAAVRRRVQARRQERLRASRHHHAHAAATATVQPVRYTTSSTSDAGSPSPPGSGSSASAASSPAPEAGGTTTSSPVAVSAPASSAGTASSGTASSSSNQPATGANGSLSPGSSPDG